MRARRCVSLALLLTVRSSLAAEIGRIGQCSVAPDSASFDALWKWEARLHRSAHNKSVFGRTTNLYVNDRCFAPRRVCKVHVHGSGATLLLPRDGPSTVQLQSRQYDVVLGAAQVMGVVARTSFPSLIEQGGGLPFINLGKGAAGPHIYTDQTNWAALSPLFTNARAIVICVMAGRSSPNSESGSFSGQSFGSEQLRAFDHVLGLSHGQTQDQKAHAERLRLESLDTARRDYAELVRRVRSGVPLGQVPPRILLVWFSACPISGCEQLWQYPQYYVREARDQSSRTGASKAGVSSDPTNVLTPLARALGAEVVDASYGHLPPSPPLAMDQCTSCATTAPVGVVCISPQARDEALKAGRTCGTSCGSVRDPYYPDDAAHEYAARVIDAALRSPRTPPSVLRGGGGGSSGGALAGARRHELRAISLEGKIFYSHVHKAAGTNLIAYLTGFEGVTDCATPGGGGVVREDHTSASSWQAFSDWWFAPQPRCTFATLEEPELGVVHSLLMKARTQQLGTAPMSGFGAPLPSGNGAPPSAIPPSHHDREPHVIAFYREPLARCRSHWNYEQELCRRVPLGVHAPYCKTYFLPRFGDANRTSTQLAFVDMHCTERATRSLSALNGIQDPLAFLSEQLSFVGITEHFLESICLLLFQLGKFRRDMCTCDGGRPLTISRELRPPLNEAWKMTRLRAVGVPPLQISDSELLRRNPNDQALYAGLLRLFKHRMHALETAVKSRVWACKYR